MRRSIPRFTIASFVLFSACAQVEQYDLDLEAIKSELLRLDARWAEVAHAGANPDIIVSFYGDQAVAYPPRQPLVAGKVALRGLVGRLQRFEGFSITWESHSVNVSPDGKMAIIHSDHLIGFDDPEGDRIEEKGRAIRIWDKQDDGSWKCVVDIWNLAPPE